MYTFIYRDRLGDIDEPLSTLQGARHVANMFFAELTEEGYRIHHTTPDSHYFTKAEGEWVELFVTKDGVRVPLAQ